MRESLLKWFGLSDQFSSLILILALALALSPWLSGQDFGVVKIPRFTPKIRRSLRITGPLILITIIFANIPLLSIPKSGCSISGRVFNSINNQPIPGIIIGLDKYTEDVKSPDAKEIEFNSARSGVDGSYKLDCEDVHDSDFPIRIVIHNTRTNITFVTEQKIELGDIKTDVNLVISMPNS